MNLSQPTPYTSCIASINTTPLETPLGYRNISTNHHFSYHMNNCTYNYSINSSRNKTLMNKILCSSYFIIDIIRHTPPEFQLNPSTKHGLTSFIPSCLPDSQLYRYVRRYNNNTLIAFSVALLFIYSFNIVT